MKFRNKRLETASQGKQAPLLIDCPWLYSNLKKNNLKISMKEFDITIVGLGPAGGTLANLLAMHGFSILILDKEKVFIHYLELFILMMK